MSGQQRQRVPPGAETPGRVGDVRRGNLARVLTAIARWTSEQSPTRAQLATLTGLTKASVSSLVTELIEQGLVVEIGQHRDGERGRPGVGLGLDPSRCVLGMEVNVDYVSAGLVNLSGQPINHAVLPRDNRSSRPEEVTGALGELITEYRNFATNRGITILGGALAIPGLVDSRNSLVLHAPNLGWDGIRLGLAGLLPDTLLGVSLFNEANASAVAYRQSVPQAPATFLFVSGEVGIGGAVVIDSELFTGPHGAAGEIGHVIVQPGGSPCSCGAHGCLETMAGQDAIYRASGVLAPVRNPGQPVTTDPEPRETIALLHAALVAGEPQALDAVDRAGYYLGAAVASSARLLDVHTVVLGGHFAALGQWIVPALHRSAADHGPASGWPLRIILSPLGATAALVGAAQSVVRDLLEHPPVATQR